jgi:hypothetical protein
VVFYKKIFSYIAQYVERDLNKKVRVKTKDYRSIETKSPHLKQIAVKVS